MKLNNYQLVRSKSLTGISRAYPLKPTVLIPLIIKKINKVFAF